MNQQELADVFRLITVISAASLAGRMLPMFFNVGRRRKLRDTPAEMGMWAVALFSLSVLLFSLLALWTDAPASATIYIHPLYYLCVFFGHRYADRLEHWDNRDYIKKVDLYQAQMRGEGQ